ncbi:MAG: hypothetical protein JW806_01495 [Sedimentisphaerales bacterium]|nr:hypothetical protein [Sedimentisphaerales bacterium]
MKGNISNRLLLVSGVIFCLVLSAFAGDGEIIAWGQNNYGQCDVPLPNVGFTAISAGWDYSLGLRDDGSIMAWGCNNLGQCNVPSPNIDFVAISAGGYHSLGLKADGSIVAWGYNGYGECNVPSPNTDFAAIAAGLHYSLSLKIDGSIITWGWNNSGQCDVPSPNMGFVAIATGGSHSLGLKADGSIIGWGQNNYGQCNVPSPNTDFVAIMAGLSHSLGLRADGSIIGWGNNSSGSGQCNVPSPNTDFVAIASGCVSFHSLGLKLNSSIVAWGNNNYGQCDVPEPNKDFTNIAAGRTHSLGLKSQKYSGGTGEPNDPYRIADVNDLLELAGDENDYNDCFILVNDINLADYTFTDVIGPNHTLSFTGVFDGNGHVISNLTIDANESDYAGLFGVIHQDGIIKDVVIEDANITGGWYVGGLSGYSSCRISNCCATGIISGSSYVGGLVGYNRGSISNCYSMSTVSGSMYVGGLVGDGRGGNISNCYSTGTVSSSSYVGGLVGRNWSCAMLNCYSAGVVSGDSYVGGLIGDNINNDIILGCFWDIETSGQMTSAGGEGKTTIQMYSFDTFNSWSCDEIWTINNGNDYPRLAWQNIGGQLITPELVYGGGTGTEEDPYLIYTAEQFNAIIYTYCHMDMHFKLMSDIDFSGYLGNKFNIISNIAFPFTGVFDGNNHLISNLAIDANGNNYVGLFGYIGPNSVIKNIGIADANISGRTDVGSLAGYNGGSIRNCYSMGTVSGFSRVGGLVGLNEGDGISNCYSTGAVSGDEGIGGLCGYSIIGNITNCFSTASVAGTAGTGGLCGRNYVSSILNCYSTGSVNGYGQTGGLVGYNNGDIMNCCSEAVIVSNDDYAGGLVGYNESLGSINSCYSKGSVDGSLGIGGIAGYNKSYIANCYSQASVSGTLYVGGLTGFNYGNITNCYSTGAVSGNSYVGGITGREMGTARYFDTFWDVNSCGTTDGVGSINPDPNGVTGLPTLQMQEMSTYVNAGWDFSYTDGNDADWFIQIDEYPILVWQISPADIYTDGRNDFRDFCVFAQFWLREDCSIYNYYCDWADLDFDGDVDFNDLSILIDYWLEKGIYN